MKITICGSMVFADKFNQLKSELENMGHIVYIPIEAVSKESYMSNDPIERIEAKKRLGLVNAHLDKIEISEAILIANYTKNNIENYIGANCFLEIGYAHYRAKKIFSLNPLPDQQYIRDEILSFDIKVINNDLKMIC